MMEAAGGVWQAAVIARASGSPRAGHRARRASAASFTSSEEAASDPQARPPLSVLISAHGDAQLCLGPL